MDTIIYNQKLADAIETWWALAEYKGLDYMPFKEIKVQYKDLKGDLKGLENRLEIVLKEDSRVLYKDGNSKQVMKCALQNKEIIVEKITYSDLPKEKQDKASIMASKSLEFIFSFMINYNLPQNSKAKGFMQMRELMYNPEKFLKRRRRVIKSKANNRSMVRVAKEKSDKPNVVNILELAPMYKNRAHGNRKRAHEYTCDAWTVKGFYRKTKLGKIVWVSPCVKGKNKEKLKDKIYKV